MAVVERIVSPFAGRRGTPAGAAPPAASAAVSALALRAMTGFEEEVVERSKDGPNTAALCNEIVARCLVEPGADPAGALQRVRALTVAERDLALIAVRKLSFGDVVECKVDCPACGALSDIDFRLSALPIEVPAAPERIAVQLPDGRRATLRLPTAGDQEELLGAALVTASESTSFLLGRVTRLEGCVEPIGFQSARALPVAARRALEQALDGAIVDLALEMGVTCVACGHAFSTPFDVASFFLPS